MGWRSGTPGGRPIAVTLVELVTGAPAHTAPTTLPPVVHAITARALASAATDRYPSVEAMRGALADVQRTLPPVDLLALAAWVTATQPGS